MGEVNAPPNPESSFLIQNRALCCGNVHSEMPGNRKDLFLQWGDLLAPDKHNQAFLG